MEVYTQEELDAILPLTSGFIYICFGTLDEPAIVSKRCLGFVAVRGDYYVEAHGNIRITASDGAYIEAYDDSSVSALHGSVVEANDRATVCASCGSFVEAYGQSYIDASYGSFVQAYEDSTVVAYKGSKVELFGNPTVYAHKEAKVEYPFSSRTVTKLESAVFLKKAEEFAPRRLGKSVS